MDSAIILLLAPISLLITLAVLCLMADIRARQDEQRRGFGVVPRRK